MSAQLKSKGYHVGRRKARRFMNEMDIYPIYPKMNLSKRMQQAKVCPYLLRNAIIDKPNQAWSIDITYIPIRRGFLYLTAIIDWHSRCIVGWEVDDTLDTRMVINALKKAFMVAKPQILNSDQGCQFTSQQYIDFVKENGIRQSMDGKSRWADNIMIERWFRSFKYEEAYLTQYNNIKEARAAIGQYIHTYNFERRHSALDYQTPPTCSKMAIMLSIKHSAFSPYISCGYPPLLYGKKVQDICHHGICCFHRTVQHQSPPNLLRDDGQVVNTLFCYQGAAMTFCKPHIVPQAL